MHPQQDRQQRLGRRATGLAAERNDRRVHAAVELPEAEGVEREAGFGHHSANDAGLRVGADLGGPAREGAGEVTRLERPGQPAGVVRFGHPTPFHWSGTVASRPVPNPNEFVPNANKFDAIVVGGGHNGLVAAAYLARGRKARRGARAAAVGGRRSSDRAAVGS